MKAQVKAMLKMEKQTEAVTFDNGRPVIAGTRIPSTILCSPWLLTKRG